ncbi:MAG TPA: elongation factor G [Ignavibacteriales bacterium]|nr:elongation factor G [Ignavibacteriales bacterium]
MKDYTPQQIRNMAFIGHGGSGKTSISEYLLFLSGETNRIGKVEEGNTASDFTAIEVERKMSIFATPLYVEHKNCKINFIDTPGYADFIGQVKSSLHVVEMAVPVIKAADGIEVGTEITWKFVSEYKLPASILVNKIDNEHSKYFNTVEMAKTRLSGDVFPVTFPVNEGLNVNAVVDVVNLKQHTYGDANSKKIDISDLSGELLEKAQKLRDELIEKIAGTNEELMNNYFENGTLTADEIKKGLKEAIISRNLIPVFAVSANKGVGLDIFLNFAVDYFPAPSDIDTLNTKLGFDLTKSPTLFVFKTVSEKHTGEVSYFKAFAGNIVPGIDMNNLNNNKIERLGTISFVNGKVKKETSKVIAGDIACIVKLKDTHVNHTLSVNKSPEFKIPEIVFPESIISAAIKPKQKGDEDKIAAGLHSIHEEDPTFTSHYDPELGQTIIEGQGELQLQLVVKTLKEKFNVDVELVEPKIPYRETIKGKVEAAEYKHKKQTGGRGQYGHVVLRLEPLPRGTGFEFVNAIVGGVVPGRFVPAVEKGIVETMAKGVLAGSKVIDVKATLHFGSYHDVDSDEMSFKIAASQAFRKGFLEAKPVILEPIYQVEITVPEEFMGDVMGDVSSRRGKISGMEADGPYQIIKALIPLAELHKYSTVLRSLTQGRGIFTRKFSHYEEVPKEVETKIIEAYKQSKQEEEA